MKSDFFIIGLGQIGGSLALALKKKKIARKVYGLDVRHRPEFSRILDGYVSDLEEGVKKSKVIVLATPLVEIKKFIRKIGPLMEEKQILIDTGSTKREIIQEMNKFSGRSMFGGHPMVGTVKQGPEAWNPELFSEKPFFLCRPRHKISQESFEKIWKIIEAIGAVPLEISATVHDQYVALTSQLPYFISLALFSLFIKKHRCDKEIENFVATGFLGATRLSLTAPAVGAGMVLTNQDNLVCRIEEFIKEMKCLSGLVKKKGFERKIARIYSEAEKRREFYEKAFPKN
jgi:prephenate dehydrogenase